MLALTFSFLTGSGLYLSVNHVAIWVELWMLVAFDLGELIFFLWIKLMVMMMMRHEEKEKWKAVQVKKC